MGWKNYISRNMILYVISSLFCTVLVYFIMSLTFFPSHIQILKDKDNNFNFSLPISATIIPDNLDVLQVNNSFVSDNISVKLNKDITIKSEETGKANMKLNAFGIPVKNVVLDVISDMKVVPVGMTVGVKINTEGIMVLGTGYVNGKDGATYKPSEGILKSGDLILKANGERLNKKEDLLKIVEENSNNINLTVKRDSDIIETNVTPVKSLEEDINKIGAWVRDSTQGIGTITYYNPYNNKFGALGHGILDVDTKQLMSVEDGDIMRSEIISIQKGEKGVPGELIGNIDKKDIIGSVVKNTKFGLYGYLDNEFLEGVGGTAVEIGLQGDVHEGPATIYSNIEGTEVKKYDIYIENVNRYSSDDSKGMVMRITDRELLNKTNGIVQGMSGSPIIQDGKLIGAVTHVFVQDPAKGYGIFIENMLKQENNM